MILSETITADVTSPWVAVFVYMVVDIIMRVMAKRDAMKALYKTKEIAETVDTVHHKVNSGRILMMRSIATYARNLAVASDTPQNRDNAERAERELSAAINEQDREEAATAKK